MSRSTSRHVIARLTATTAVLGYLIVAPTTAEAATCGTSGGHTICVTAPSGPLAGAAGVTVTNSPNNGTVIARWLPSSQPAVTLITKVGPSAGTNDYSFVWPTHKHLDASGTLRVYAGSTSSTPVSVSITLSNGNVSDFQHSPSDWADFLPGPWSGPIDPVVAAVGDGPDGEPDAADVSKSIAFSQPDLFLFLGDIYEEGTFTENLNHYGQNSMDGGSGTIFGQMGTITQPTIGNHEAANFTAWQDYFHGRPLYTSFRFGNVLFFDLSSEIETMGLGGAQYEYVESILTSTTNPPPPCIVTFFHKPALAKDTINNARREMWSLLSNHGGDLVLNGHVHTMIEYKPLNDQLQLPSSGQPTMVQLVNGAGGHGVGGAFTSDARVAWSQGSTPGATYLTLNGAANGGTPSSISWAYEDTDGSVLRTGSRACGGSGPAAPTITTFSPTSGPVGTSVTIDGSNFSGATDVLFNGASVGAGNFTVQSATRITAIVPAAATTGPISIVTPGGTGASSTDFTVTTGTAASFGPTADTYVRSDQPTIGFGSKPKMTVDGSPTKDLLLRFTVTGLGSSAIDNVLLRLHCLDPSPFGGAFHPVTDDGWQENVSWNAAPPAEPSTITSLGSVATGTWYEVDVSEYVTGDGTYSFRVTSTSKNAANYATEEGAAGLAPQLVVNFA